MLRGACGAYLVWLGRRLVRHAARPLDPGSGVLRRSFLRGLLTNLTNPKAMLFFGAVLTALLPPTAPGWLGACAVVLIVVSSALWHLGVALLFSTGRVRDGYRRARVAVNRVAGALFVAFGLALVLE
ncbi:LysE family transporter [Actinophytocola sp.]|uniref:LysE family transporter n=1 Tax=Actinophytocola sp. TaxID=1872138 RepID=UPI0025BA6F1B|nr:LysE family transporter [Actinophytocola sp.]